MVFPTTLKRSTSFDDKDGEISYSHNLKRTASFPWLDQASLCHYIEPRYRNTEELAALPTTSLRWFKDPGHVMIPTDHKTTMENKNEEMRQLNSDYSIHRTSVLAGFGPGANESNDGAVPRIRVQEAMPKDRVVDNHDAVTDERSIEDIPNRNLSNMGDTLQDRAATGKRKHHRKRPKKGKKHKNTNPASAN